MRIYSHIVVKYIHYFNIFYNVTVFSFSKQLVGAVVLLAHFKGSDSYTLNRNVVDADDSLEATTDHSLEATTDDSLETTTVNLLDSTEHINQTSTEDNSMEAGKRLVKRNVLPAVTIHDYDDYYHDYSIETTTVDDVSLEDILKQQQSTVATTPAVQTTTLDDDIYDDLVNSTEDLLDTHNDTSLENSNDDVNNIGAAVTTTLPSLSILSHLPVIGVFSHPASDDLYLVKQYLGDYYFWEMDDDFARNYFSQTVKDTTKFDFFDSPIKVDAVQFTQFTPVRSLPADRLQVPSTAAF